MANILTASEAGIVLRCSETDPDMLAWLPSVDAYIFHATGRDWTVDSPIKDEAKSAARILLVLWHENPSMVGNESAYLGPGLSACLLQLETLVLAYSEFYGRKGAGACRLPGARRGDVVDSLVGLVGESGDQSNAFETFISVTGEIQQVSTSDLSEVMFRVKLTPPSEL